MFHLFFICGAAFAPVKYKSTPTTFQEQCQLPGCQDRGKMTGKRCFWSRVIMKGSKSGKLLAVPNSTQVMVLASHHDLWRRRYCIREMDSRYDGSRSPYEAGCINNAVEVVFARPKKPTGFELLPRHRVTYSRIIRVAESKEKGI